MHAVHNIYTYIKQERKKRTGNDTRYDCFYCPTLPSDIDEKQYLTDVTIFSTESSMESSAKVKYSKCFDYTAIEYAPSGEI